MSSAFAGMIRSVPLPTTTPSPAFGRGEVLKTTQSVCPTCLATIPAQVLARDKSVWLDKTCPAHGDFSALLASDRRHYYLADPNIAALGSCCGPGSHCGDQVANHSCNVLIELTQRCNLSCPTCYADSSPQQDHMLSHADFSALLDKLLAKTGGDKADADVVQFSGGEPTIHPEFWAFLDLALARGVRRVYVNTNGTRLAKRDFAARLAAYGDRVGVYLQLDGLTDQATVALRGETGLLARKLRALQHCEELGIDTVWVMTLAPGINDTELGACINRAAASPVVHKMMIQPAMYSGRYDNPQLVRRTTVADVARLASEQTATLQPDDFLPIPCSDPNCFSMAMAFKTPGGLLPVSRFFPRYETWAAPGVAELISKVSNSFDRADDLRHVVSWAVANDALQGLDEAALDQVLDALQASMAGEAEQLSTAATGETADEWRGMLAIGVKPFMDAWTYDQDRIDKCCVHVASADGTPVSFCEYNALWRPQGRL